MEQNIFDKLEQQVMSLLDAYRLLQTENDKLQQQQSILIAERDHLLAKNKTAVQEIKQLIQHARTAKHNHRQ